MQRPHSNYTSANYKVKRSKKNQKIIIDQANYQTNNPRIDHVEKRSLKRPVSAAFLHGKHPALNYLNSGSIKHLF